MILLVDKRIPVEFLRFVQFRLDDDRDVVVVSPPSDRDICEQLWGGEWPRDTIDMPDDVNAVRVRGVLYVRRLPTPHEIFEAAIAAQQTGPES